MGQMSLPQTLAYLNKDGIVLPTETQTALAHSLLLKKNEAGVDTMGLHAKVQTASGKDYLLAYGLKMGKPSAYYSTDGVTFVDFQVPDAATLARCEKIKGPFSGDLSTVYVVEEPKAAAEAPAEEEAAPAGEDGEAAPADEAGAEPAAPAVDTYEILEVDRLFAFYTELSKAAIDVVPDGAFVVTATGDRVPNKLFSGVPYPDKLESYVHWSAVTGKGQPLSKDIRGSWSLQYDSFTQVATLRSLVFPGFELALDNADGNWGKFYVGLGEKNEDLAFMI